MKKACFYLWAFSVSCFGLAQVRVSNAVVPRFIHGNAPSNNRVPCYFWAEISGLTPGATYRYYTQCDTLNSNQNQNGAGNSFFINTSSATFRRTTNSSFSSALNYDSLTANDKGVYSGWFGVEATSNSRFSTGNNVYPVVILNNGNGGTSTTHRIRLREQLMQVVQLSTAKNSNSCSAIIDSSHSSSQAKEMVLLFDEPSGTSRPISITVVEDDGLNISNSTTASFYKDKVDNKPNVWGTILPNVLEKGVQRVEYRKIHESIPSNTWIDHDGNWCKGMDTRNPSWGNSAKKLNSSLNATNTSILVPDELMVGQSGNFSISSLHLSIFSTWDFGDNSKPSLGNQLSHSYQQPGKYEVTTIIQSGSCIDTANNVLQVHTITAIEDTHLESVLLTPNPAMYKISCTLPADYSYQIHIFNSLGNMVSSIPSVRNGEQIDIAGLPSGMYLVKIESPIHSTIKKIYIQ